jgi:hypothetical protein
MGRLYEPEPVKPILGIITRFTGLFEDVKRVSTERWGPIELESQIFNFDFTEYYRPQMGTDLKRKFLSFRDLVRPEHIVELKLWAQCVEEQWGKSGGFGVPRPLNLDPGYISLSKLVLASTKDYNHRIYLRDRIYAEVTLAFKGGRFQPYPWTYPDYKTPGYIGFFTMVRQMYHAQLIQWRAAQGVV